MHLHILGICGTFMGGIALLARELGHTVTGSDSQVYPPMSTQLEAQGIELMQGYHAAHLRAEPDCVVVGNALSRGNPEVEYLLDRDLPYTSGPQWLAEHVLRGRWVLAVAGTHGKTTTSSMLAWILDHAGLRPGFLIGGVPENFGLSARVGQLPYFVVEGDEYDTAFFDKRSKFVHYRPRTLVLNNLELDHSDIFDDLEAIKRQFHHLVRTVPGAGRILVNAADPALRDVLVRGCWTPTETFGAAGALWTAQPQREDCSLLDVCCGAKLVGRLAWDLLGRHNTANALAAIAAARHAGVSPAQAIEALSEFRNVKRRMELRGVAAGVSVYDDFAHHPTAIALTLEGLRRRVGTARILAILEPRSNTMRRGTHRESLAASLDAADRALLYRPAELAWDLIAAVTTLGERVTVLDDTPSIIDAALAWARPGDHVLIMSNGGFEDIHERLLSALGSRARLEASP